MTCREATRRKEDETRDETILIIANEILRMETLETRHNDSHDFHDMSTWSIREALEAAYEAGRASAND